VEVPRVGRSTFREMVQIIRTLRSVETVEVTPQSRAGGGKGRSTVPRPTEYSLELIPAPGQSRDVSS
jgi:hypothetical protein